MKKKILLLGLLMLVLGFAPTGSATAELVFDNFDDGTLGTNLGGMAGPMSPDLDGDGLGEYDPTISFTPDSADGAYALSLAYNFPTGQWSGYWSYANDEDPDNPPDKTIDVSSYNELRMWVKGTLGNEQFKIELKSGVGETSYYYVTNLGTTWNEVRVPFSNFQKVPWETNPVDVARLRQLNIVFDKSPRDSTVYIDNIQFATTEYVPQAPIASFSYTPSSPAAGESVVFDASDSTDPDGTIVSYSWNFGDGGTGTGMTVSHTYSNEGNYHVLLTVTDNGGLTDTESVLVIISSEPPPGPSDNETPSEGGPLSIALIIGTAVLIVLGIVTAVILIKGRKYPEARLGWESGPEV